MKRVHRAGSSASNDAKTQQKLQRKREAGRTRPDFVPEKWDVIWSVDIRSVKLLTSMQTGFALGCVVVWVWSG